MKVEIVKSEKDNMEVKLDNQTSAEVLRVYLNETVQGVKFAVWRREHPSKPVVLKIQTSGKTAKKAISEAVSAIEKDCDLIIKGLKKK